MRSVSFFLEGHGRKKREKGRVGRLRSVSCFIHFIHYGRTVGTSWNVHSTYRTALANWGASSILELSPCACTPECGEVGLTYVQKSEPTSRSVADLKDTSDVPCQSPCRAAERKNTEDCTWFCGFACKSCPAALQGQVGSGARLPCSRILSGSLCKSCPAALQGQVGGVNTIELLPFDSRIEIIPDDQGSRITPFYVAFTDEEHLFGKAAKIRSSSSSSSSSSSNAV